MRSGLTVRSVAAMLLLALILQGGCESIRALDGRLG